MPARSEALSLDNFAPRQIQSLIGAMSSFPPPMRDRGREYAVRARVGRLLVLPDAVGARVRGTRVYEVWWTWEHSAWDCTCTCPTGYDCKHQYAVACCLLEPLRGPGADRRLARLLPSRPVTWASLGQPDAQNRPTEDARADDDDDDESFDEDDSDQVIAHVGALAPVRPQPPPPIEIPSWRPEGLTALRTARDSWSRIEALRRLLSENPRATARVSASSFMQVLSERDFDVMCWHLARLIPLATAGWLPPALEPYRNREDLEQRYVSELREALVARLSGWSAERPHTAERRLRFVLGLTGGNPGSAGLTMEARLTSTRLDDRPRSIDQLRALLGEAERNPGGLPDEQAALLDAYLSNAGGWIVGSSRTGSISTTALKRMLEAGGGTRSLVWDERLDPELAARFGVTPGATVRLGPGAVSIVPLCERRGAELALELKARWPDGRDRSFDRVLLLRGSYDGGRRHPSLVISDGDVHRVAELPPGGIIDLFAATGGLPLERETHSRLIETLAERFITVRHSLAPFTRIWAARPIVAIDVRDDDWLQIRVFAASADAAWKPVETVARGARVLEYAPDAGWAELPAAPKKAAPEFEPTSPAAGDAETKLDALLLNRATDASPGVPPESDGPIWLERMDDATIAPLLEWLGRTGADDGTKPLRGARLSSGHNRRVGWWIRLGPKRIASFGEAWDTRPEGVQWFCTPAARRMLGEVRPVRARLKVQSAGVDWFSVNAEWEAEGMTLTDDDLAALRRATGAYVKISTGWLRREAGASVERDFESLADLGIEPGAGAQRVSLWQLAQARPESLQAFEEMGADSATVSLVQRLRGEIAAFQGLPHAEVPATFTGTLRPYQQQGVDFLAYVSTLRLGAVLADDMGLGKTVQALAWLLWLRERDPKLGPALVVCPASVVHNWAREAETFAPHLKVALLTSGVQRRALLREAASHDLLVTNYALMRRDIEAWRGIPLGALILDEAQNIKNPDAAVSRAALRLDARHRLALTGTPLENRALDLWSIMTCVNPGLLGSRAAFTARYERADAPAHVRRLLAARLRPVLLRRLKKDVATELPERIEERRDCELHPGQRRLYLAELGRSRALLEELSDDPGDFARRRIEVLAALTRLRQICCHPALTGHTFAGGSGKFDALWEILDPLLAEGQKVLVFSQFVRCLTLLRGELAERGIACHMLTGQTRKREEVVDGFQNDERPGVFLISLKAGGTGLNLTAASYVVLFDPWWNPAVEAQAIDRTHRIGQTRTVIAYRMLAQGTIEDKIWELQQRKAALARDVLGEDGFARALTREDLEYLFAAP